MSLLADCANRRRRAPIFDLRVAIAQRILDRIDHRQSGRHAPNGERFVGEGSAGDEATLHLHNWRALRRVLTGGDIGFARAVIDGDCSSPDLVALLRLFDRNVAALGGAAASVGPARWLQRLALAARANTRAGIGAQHHGALRSRQRILRRNGSTPSMSYSSGDLRRRRDTLEAAQRASSTGSSRCLRLAAASGRWRSAAAGARSPARLVATGAAALDALTLSPAQADDSRAASARRRARRSS